MQGGISWTGRYIEKRAARKGECLALICLINSKDKLLHNFLPKAALKIWRNLVSEYLETFGKILYSVMKS